MDIFRLKIKRSVQAILASHRDGIASHHMTWRCDKKQQLISHALDESSCLSALSSNGSKGCCMRADKHNLPFKIKN